MQIGVSLCMIVRNEEEYLDACLKSVDGVANEMIIVDTGSTDSTVEIARRHGARVVFHSWENDFSAARNLSLESAAGNWILVLDADEELSRLSREKMRDFIKTSQADGVEMVVRSEMPETDVLKYEDMMIVRLFRNRKNYRYTMPVHEQIRGSIEQNGGKIERSDLMIVHHGYSRKTVQGAEDRGERNLAILRHALSRSDDDPYLHYQTGVTLMSMGRKEEAYAEMKRVLTLDYAGMGSEILERLFMKMSQVALERNENDYAVMYARRCLDYNASNGIAMYVAAFGLLSMNKITDGYQMLLRIRENGGSNLRLDIQLEHLIRACKELLKV